MKQLAIFSLVFFLIGGCTKFGKNITIKGRVVNPITGEGIEGAEIWLQKTAGGYDGGYKTVKKAISGIDGVFELSKLGLAGYSAVCGKFSGDYYELGWTQDDGETYTGNFKLSVKKGKTMYADYYAVPYGNLILNIQNVNCGGLGDTMYFREKWLGYGDFEGSYSTPRTGCYSYTSPSPFQVPMGTYVYEMKIIRSGITTYVYDTVVVPKTGVTTINMDY